MLELFSVWAILQWNHRTVLTIHFLCWMILCVRSACDVLYVLLSLAYVCALHCSSALDQNVINLPVQYAVYNCARCHIGHKYGGEHSGSCIFGTHEFQCFQNLYVPPRNILFSGKTFCSLPKIFPLKSLHWNGNHRRWESFSEDPETILSKQIWTSLSSFNILLVKAVFVMFWTHTHFWKVCENGSSVKWHARLSSGNIMVQSSLSYFYHFCLYMKSNILSNNALWN